MLDGHPDKPKRTVNKRSRVAITKRTLDALKPDVRDCVLWDRETKRFGLRITSTGVMSFVIQYRNAQGRSRRLTIGTYGTWTPAAAREEAERMLRIADGGGDPAQIRRDERSAITFRSLAQEYLDKAEKGLIITRARRRKKPGTVVIDKYRMQHLVAHFGDKPAKDIARADCQRCLESLMAGRHGAARTFGLLGAVFSYAIDQQHISHNPARGITKPADGRREFRLDVGGYRALGEALETAEARAEAWQAVAAIRLLALTGCRKGEILRLQRTEVDVAGRCIRLRDSKTTSNETAPSVRPLSSAALEVLSAVLVRPGRPESPYVLPGPYDPRKPFNGLGGAGYGAWGRIVGDGYSPHGLRHAFASACDDVGLSELSIAMLLGHASAKKGSTTRRYISRPDAVILAAADQVGRYIAQAMRGELSSCQIVELPRFGAA